MKGTDPTIRPLRLADRDDALALYDVLEQDVLPAFYDRDADGLPRAWIDRMRHAMKTLPYPFSAGRMVIEYVEQVYRAGHPARHGDSSVAA